MANDDLRFDPDNLITTVIAVPLLRQIEAGGGDLIYVIIDVNIRYAGGRQKAQAQVYLTIDQAVREAGDRADQGVNRSKSDASSQYVYAKLQGKVIRRLVEIDQSGAGAIYHVWPDFIIRAQIWKSVPTVKADACRRAFAATGKGILWAMGARQECGRQSELGR